MGVQYADGAGLSLQLWIVVREGFEGLPATTDHHVIKCALVLPGQRPKFGRQGEGQQKRTAVLFFELPF